MPRSVVPGPGAARLIAGLLLGAQLIALPGRLGATPLEAPAPAPATWLATTTADALRRAQTPGSVSAGAAGFLNQGFARGMVELRRHRPDWLASLDLRLQLAEDLRAGYELTAAQTLFHRAGPGDRVVTEGRLIYDPAGRTTAQIGLRYQGRVRTEPVALALRGTHEDRWLWDDYNRRALEAELSSFPLTLKARAFNDLPKRRPRAGDLPDRPLDGYHVQLELRVPHLPWAQVSAHRSWQIPFGSEQPSHADGLGLRLQPIGPLQLEAGTTGSSIVRTWSARLRFALPLGGDA